ncbi:MAG: hypothetical protein GY856_21245 [bacterium]|nr:hypothetical protein [bacterium]
MSDAATHLTLDVLADYFAEVLGDEQEESVELHLADCDRCAANARWVHTMHEKLEPSLGAWTAASHAEAVVRAVLSAAFDEAPADAEPDVKERLDRWSERLASGALHLIREASGRLSRRLNVLMPPPGWEMTARSFAVASGPTTAFKGSDPETDTAPAPEAPTIRVGRKGLGIEVRIGPMDVGELMNQSEESRLVALVPTREGGRPEVKALRPASDKPRTWMARFKVDGDDFVVVLEP